MEEETMPQRMEREVAEAEAELRGLEEGLAQKHQEWDALKAGLRSELESEMREVVAFAKSRGHAWPGYRMALLGPQGLDEESLISTLADLFVEGEMGDYRRETGSTEQEIRRKRKDIKKQKGRLESFRETFGS